MGEWMSEWVSDWVKTVRQQESNVNYWDLKAVPSCDGTQGYGLLAIIDGEALNEYDKFRNRKERFFF
jgi:hypothetical protein